MSPSSTPKAHGRDWANGWNSYALRWGLPSLAVIAGLFVPIQWRVPIWCVALIIMGVSCLINARQCGRVHCRYTGPWYLILIAPTLWLGLVASETRPSQWLLLAALILLGSKLIWWLTERRSGRYRDTSKVTGHAD